MHLHLAACILVVVLSSDRWTRIAQAAPPNIVFVYADDLDFDEIGVYDYREFPCCTGAKARGFLKGPAQAGYANPSMLTPNIDSLARDGALFTRFYITTAICTPSRYSVMTGRYASRSPGFCEKFPPGGPCNIRWNTPVDPTETNLAKALKATGYKTGLVGKWHSGNKGGKARGIKPDDDPTDPAIAKKIKAAYDAGVDYLRDEIGFDFVERIYFGNKESLGLPEVMKVHNLEWFTEGALEFIDANHEEPFFLYMPLTLPHGQYNANWLDANPRYTPSGVLDEPPKGQFSRRSILDRLAARGINRRNAPATWIDDAVGAILVKLYDLGIADNTIVVFSSDHQSRGKYTCYESSRVPMLVRWPAKIAPGTRVESVCANIDLLPTFLEAAGAPIEASEDVDGQSFLPFLLGQSPDAPWREALLLECSNIRAVVTDRWKYVANRPGEDVLRRMREEAEACERTGGLPQIGWDGDKNPHPHEKGIRYRSDRDFPAYFDVDQLYDLQNDPFEQVNLAVKPAEADVLAELKGQLQDLLAPMPHTFGEFKTDRVGGVRNPQSSNRGAN